MTESKLRYFDTCRACGLDIMEDEHGNAVNIAWEEGPTHEKCPGPSLASQTRDKMDRLQELVAYLAYGVKDEGQDFTSHVNGRKLFHPEADLQAEEDEAVRRFLPDAWWLPENRKPVGGVPMS